MLKKNSIFTTNVDGKLRVLKWTNNENVLVRFENTGSLVTATAGNIRAGSVKDPLSKRVAGIGYEGIGDRCIKPSTRALWRSVLQRAGTQAGYRDVSVDRRWHNLQVFAGDVETMKNCHRRGFNFDKDLRIFGSRVYSKDTCSFVPFEINRVINFKTNSTIYSGVYKSKTGDRPYYAQVRNNGKTQNLGSFRTKEEAIDAYLCAKIKVIRRIAKQYKDALHPEVYNNLIKITPDELDSLYQNSLLRTK